jgi:cellulose synthase/poly-beta-1,6-N-acetylglucosamine synthase-like glycosyltransferase
VLLDWTHWLSSLHPDQLLMLLGGLLLMDAPRYAFSKIIMCLWDSGLNFWQWARGHQAEPAFTYCPSVCVVIAGYNEEETIEATLQSLWGSYPKLEIVVVDDGSLDRMTPIARRFARNHAGVQVVRRPERGGKASATNAALLHTRAEVIVVVDADSDLGPSAVWEIVQPLADPEVGAVAGAVLARSFTNLVTWLQAYEYLHSIFVGRILSARMGILGIVSGAFGAFRRAALDRVMGWDVGPPEDLDLTLTLRKAGYKIAFAPYAQCYTDLPPTWWALIKQRLRWDRSGAIRNHCRKHLDMAFFWRGNFRFSDFCVVLESWFFNIFCMYGIWAWVIWICFNPIPHLWQLLLSLYLCYIVFELIQVLSVFLYSTAPARDALICAVFALAPLYNFVLLAVRLVATTEEIFLRKSFEDNYVPARVRQATWRW